MDDYEIEAPYLSVFIEIMSDFLFTLRLEPNMLFNDSREENPKLFVIISDKDSKLLSPYLPAMKISSSC